MDKRPITTLQLETLQRLTEEFTSTVRRIDLHRWDYVNAENLANMLRALDHTITVAPPHSPLQDLNPRLFCIEITPQLIGDITSVGFTPIKNGDYWQINPPGTVGEFAMSFKLLEQP